MRAANLFELIANLAMPTIVLSILGVRALIHELRKRSARATARRQLRAGAPQLADHELVTVTGTVRACAALIEAPLSGRRVVFHHTEAFVRGIRRQLVACELATFELETAQGVVRIEGETAEIAFAPRPVDPVPVERVKRFLAAHGIEAAYHVGTVGVGEVAIEPGARIAVRGVAQAEADPASAGERGFRDSAPVRMTLRGGPGHPLMVGPPEG